MLRGLENPPLSGYSKKAVSFPPVLEIKQFSNKTQAGAKIWQTSLKYLVAYHPFLKYMKVKEKFLISHNSQKNTCVSVSFLQMSQADAVSGKDTSIQLFS